MIIKYRIISGEDENFVRDIEIYSDNTFLDLHMAIQAACNYDPSLLTTFFLSNASWDKVQEIILEKIDEESQADLMLMSDTRLDTFTPVIGQRYIYIFDFFSIRSFFIEIVNIREAVKEDFKLQFPICTLSKSKAPEQVFVDDINEDDFMDETEDDFEEGFDQYDLDSINDFDI
ncbi:MAG: plasmid pRiA4b ORF-3 family protein [Bacteroidales bacterium]|jgi:hypothetical protein|nr:plasmid pRiA4b ORF-3 family protein [Bacteroidales bacterium]